MSIVTEVPIASADIEQLADWVECQALLSSSKQCSRASLARALFRTGTTDTVGQTDDADDSLVVGSGPNVSQQVADDAFSEIENRGKACGNAYPFEIDQGGIRLKQIDPAESDYIFLLLLTKLGPTNGHDGTAVLFEYLCAHAACTYFGGTTNLAKVLRIGAPRRPPLATLSAAVDEMCSQLGEGGGCKSSKKMAHNVGDGQLDIVAWRKFLDDRVGKLIAFGQCAAGLSDWEDKLTELDSTSFAKKWLRESFAADPIRFFFVPWRVSQKKWYDISCSAGIVFDRSRIVACIERLDPELAKRRKEATEEMVKRALITKTSKGKKTNKSKRNAA